MHKRFENIDKIVKRKQLQVHRNLLLVFYLKLSTFKQQLKIIQMKTKSGDEGMKNNKVHPENLRIPKIWIK